MIATMRADIDCRPASATSRADRGRLLVLANQRHRPGPPARAQGRFRTALRRTCLSAAEPDFEGFADTSACCSPRARSASRARRLGAGNFDRADQYARGGRGCRRAGRGSRRPQRQDHVRARSCARPSVAAAQEPSVLPGEQAAPHLLHRTELPGPRARARDRGLGGPRVHGDQGRRDARPGRACGASRRRPSIARRPMPSGAGAMSRASSTARSSSSASRRACASSSPSNQRGRSTSRTRRSRASPLRSAN